MTSKAHADVAAVLRLLTSPAASPTGGGHAHLIKAIVARYHDVTGVLVELPQVANEVQLSSRLDVVAGDFFTVPLPRCDAYCS